MKCDEMKCDEMKCDEMKMWWDEMWWDKMRCVYIHEITGGMHSQRVNSI